MGLGTRRISHTIPFYAIERTHLVEIDVTEFSFLDHFGIKPSFKLHHEQQHLVIRPSRKEDLAGIQFEQSATNRPNIKSGVIWDAKN